MKKSLLALAATALLAFPALAKTDAQSLIPSDAVTVGVVHLDEMRSSPLSGALFQQTDKITADGDAAQFLLDAGLSNTEAFAAMYPRVAKQERVVLMPFLLDGVGGRAELNLEDGIHPNQEGQRIVAAHVLPYVERALKAAP